jgi:hypothetical protein
MKMRPEYRTKMSASEGSGTFTLWSECLSLSQRDIFKGLLSDRFGILDVVGVGYIRKILLLFQQN